MGFLSKLMKNPFVQMALPMALGYIAGPAGAALTKSMPMFQGMSPLMANALKQTAIGYGTSALSGSKRPWKGAMYAGLTSIPFSYMSAANAAGAYNKELAKVGGLDKADFMTKLADPGQKAIPGRYGYIDPDPAADFFSAGQKYIPGKPAIAPRYELAPGAEEFFARDFPTKVTPWQIATGDVPGDITIPSGEKIFKTTQGQDDGKVFARDEWTGDVIPEETIFAPDASIMTKTSPGGTNMYGHARPEAGTPMTDWLPTAAAQAAALYGGRMTPEEEWEAARRKRKKELAWMYGVPEDQIEGEMDNPWYTGGMFNSGGIASLDKSYGGDVNGPGTGTSDSIDAKLSDGEFVMTAKAVENLGGGDRYEGARKMYSMMNMLDPQSETMSEVT